MSKQSIALIGGGPAALLFASFIDTTKYEVQIYEKNKQCGRKFLVAGKGGFNLSHSEKLEDFITRYTPSNFIEPALRSFSNDDLRNWLKEIGIPTIVGSSKRIYPEQEIKPIEVLTKILNFIEKRGVKINYEYNWTGWNASGDLTFENGDAVKADKAVFAMGGGSWKVTGSDGSWLQSFLDRGVEVNQFEASNCRYSVNWEEKFIANYAGEPLKNCFYSSGNKTQSGEIVLTQNGVEGNAIYALSPEIRKDLKRNGKAVVEIDFKPNWSKNKVLEVLNKSRFNKMTDILKKDLRLSKTQISLLKNITSKDEFLSKTYLSHLIKIYPLTITDLTAIDDAISTVGGIALSSISESYELKAIPNNFTIGEMLDYDAPTGGYLLQSCFSMGVYLAQKFNVEA